ncbi:MAG TPA: Rv3654c family TadE-like protein [Nocardioidaceae bacterium]
MRRDDRGSAAVIVVGLAGVLVVFALAGATVGGLLVGQRRAAAAADLAALAAAEALASPAGSSPSGSPCAAAAAVAEANHADLHGCLTEGREVTVSVTVRVRGPAGASWDVPGRARAGPTGSAGPDP